MVESVCGASIGIVPTLIGNLSQVFYDTQILCSYQLFNENQNSVDKETSFNHIPTKMHGYTCFHANKILFYEI